MRISNPSLKRWVKKASDGELGTDENVSTYKGVYLKAGVYGAFTLISAVVIEALMMWLIARQQFDAITYLAAGSGAVGIALIIIALIVGFVPSSVKVMGIIYCILQGSLLGLISTMIDMIIPGVAFAAFLGTMIVFLVALVVNRFTQFRISSAFMRGLMVAFISLIIVELVMGILSFCGIYDFAAFWWIQLIASSLCILWATVMLFFDLQNIDYLVQTGAPKKYEWNVAFSLVTTLIYIYIEILEIIVRLVAIFGKRN